MVPVNCQAVGFTVLPNVGGIVGAIFSKNAINNWYVNLKRPKWTPPNGAFGPIWTGLYSGMGYASYLVYRDGGGFFGTAHLPLTVFAVNLAANWAWTPIFFGAKNVQLALYELQIVNVSAVAMAYLYYKVNPLAGLLIVPYCLWLGLATALNYVIWRDNKDSKPTVTKIKDK